MNSQIPQWSTGSGSVARRIGDEALEPRAHAPVVRAELGGPERGLLARAEQDVDPLGLPALQPGELLVVEEELEDVRRLRRARELRVERLVRPVGLPQEEVGDAAPAVVREDALVDDVDAVRERLLGLGDRTLPARVVEVDLADRPPLRAERLEVRVLVLEPLAEDQLRLLVHDLRPRELAARVRERERRQVLAGEERRHVGRRELELVVVDLHP